ncbi:MAG: hypothetical protein WEB09_09780 [Nitriliruptor sp.]
MLAVAVLAVLGGCTADLDPQEELAAAVEATAEEPFVFRLSAQADRSALDQLGDDAVAAASFLEGAGIEGARDPDGRLRLSLTLGGDAPLLEVIAEEGDALLLRTGLGAVLGLEGRDPATALEPALDRLGVSEAGREALITSFSGGWVALTDVDDLGELLGAASGESRTDEPAAQLDARELLGAIEVLSARDAGEVRRLDVVVETRALAELLGDGGGDRTVPGTIDLRDGRVLEVRLELSGGDLLELDPAAAGGDQPADGDAAGIVELLLRVDPVTEGNAVERPEPGASLTAAELLDLVERLSPPAG